MKRRIFTLLLTLTMALSLLPVGAAAAEEFSFSVSGGEATLIGCAKTVTGDVVIPSSYLGSPVTAIGELAFLNADRAGITSVTIPEGVRRIGRAAFSDLAAMTEVELPATLETIGESAFQDCAALTEVTLPEQVKALGALAFRSCGQLRAVTLPKGLKTIGEGAFQSCYRLKRVEFLGSLDAIPASCFYACQSLAELRLPETVKSIGAEAFAYCGMEDLALPADLETVGDRAFYDCSALRTVTLPEHTRALGSGAFGSSNSDKLFVCFSGALPELAEDVFSGRVMLGFYPADHAEEWRSAAEHTYGARVCHWRPDSELLPVTDRARERSEALEPLKSDNDAAQNYSGNWAAPVCSNLYVSADGSLTRVEAVQTADDCAVAVEQYSADGKLLWKKTLPGELPIFGGFYAGTDDNFLVFGQRNDAEDDSAEVVRVVRYTKNWHRIAAASICGADTSAPFEAGSCRMSQSGDFLYLHTSHLMYRRADGLRHQSNFSFDIHIPTMTAFESIRGYVSHSFNQFVLADGADVVRLDHGDAYPRALRLSRFDGAAGWFTESCETAEILPIYGQLGANFTGVTVGGFAAAEQYYLTVGRTREQTEDGNPFQNLFVAVTEKADLSKTEIRDLTAYPEGSDVRLSNPRLAQIASDRFLLLWTEDSVLHYVFLNGAGETVGKTYTAADVPLSDCQPVVSDQAVVWYVTEHSTPTFYSIPLDDPERISVSRDGVTVTGGTVSTVGAFTDVRSDQYYAEPVLWAVEQGITTGMTETTFAPDDTCTRAQMVTFLWRAAGKPEPKAAENPFTDVRISDYFYKAVLWAVERGITTGMTETTFAPNATVTRAQTVTFLWRMAEKPEAGNETPFTDVPAGQYYTEAILWAVGQSITNGVDETHFAPDAGCTRGQIVTFLYRAFA